MPNAPGIQAVYAMIEERKARLQALGEERHTLDSEIKGLELAVQAFVASEAGVVQARADGGDGKSFTATVTDAIEDILLVERPLHRAEILEAGEGQGHHYRSGKTPALFWYFPQQRQAFYAQDKQAGVLDADGRTGRRRPRKLLKLPKMLFDWFHRMVAETKPKRNHQWVVAIGGSSNHQGGCFPNGIR